MPVTHDDLRTLLDFHYWARDRTLDAVDMLTAEQFTRDLGSSFCSVRDTLAHMHAAEWIWLQRWHGRSPTALLPADRFPDPAAVRREWLALERQVRAVVDDLDDEGTGRLLSYTLLSGVSSASPFWQMLQHVVNHASYHRGQVTTMLRQLGAAPAKSCDMITFYRERGSLA
jgi:uncharacterized damage-inducible protein DinB